MGTVITFPESRRGGEGPVNTNHNGSATIIILPVIRIERYAEQPNERTSATRAAAPRKRRPRRRSKA